MEDNYQNIIEIKDLSFAYPNETHLALDHINLQIREGEFVVLCGKSGCGKSTLLNHLKPPLTPHGRRLGSIDFAGKPLSELSNREQSSRLGYVMQNPDNQIVTDKVWHELAFGLESLGYNNREIRIRVAEMASYFGIQDWFYKNVTELSGGQKQLLNLASIMAMHPDILILDEPASQLDPIAASDFLETVRKINRDLGTTVIITEHRLEDVFPAADRVIVMDGGHILAEGTPGMIGQILKEQSHDMFLAMPVPMQVYAKINTKENLPCPVTVRDGRDWLARVCRERGIPPYLERMSDPAAHGARQAFDQSPEQMVDHNAEQAVDGKKAHGRKPILECKDVWFRYDKNLPDVVRGLNLTIYEGEFYCLLGGNGTGKSTTMSMLCRLRRPYRGRILLDGKDIRKYSDKELFREYLGVLPQNPQSLFVKKTVELELYEMIGGIKERKNGEYDLDMDKREVVDGIARLTHMEDLMKRHPYDLSGGEQQRLALAKILLLRPKVLLMDEPTKGLDGYFKQELAEILKTLQEQGVTIFIISHDIEFCAAWADRCGLFFDGSTAAEGEPVTFFSGNNFYTTAANRMARKYFPDAITGSDVIRCLNDKQES